MRNRIEWILKLACVALGVLLLFQVVRIALRGNPLAKVSIPAVPTLAADTNSPAGAKGTNASGTNMVTKISTNAAATNLAKAFTNAGTLAEMKTPATNALPLPVSMPGAVAGTGTNRTNATGTNELVVAEAQGSGTNTTVRPGAEKNGTNAIALADKAAGTNSARASSRRPSGGSRSESAMPGMPGGGKPLPELPPATRARIDRIYESELLGSVMRPMPAALMGIAGNTAFLRSSNGQTGLVKEGDSLGEMKLVKIGVNRVLIEEKGEKKELMIFNGYGGDSLLSKKETPDETTPK
ncbi:MAG: hypothetical protein H7Y43_00665 [Akkermansiaceae bacterium]|nr:hypothetical protein [Verrucomicrobiales bacterium]